MSFAHEFRPVRSAAWPLAAPEVMYFVDLQGTWFAAEVVRASRWSLALTEPLDVETADVRLAVLDTATAPAAIAIPAWLAVLPAHELQPATMEDAALRAWQHSPSYRVPGPSPEEYVAAAFRALCPPHPPCEVGPGARGSVEQFLRERQHPLGRLAVEGRDAFNRLVRVHWCSPDHFADRILRERMRDEGASRPLELLQILQDAAISPSSPELERLALRRASLLPRLAPEHFFLAARDFDIAVAAAEEWAEEYACAYVAHYRNVIAATRATLAEIAPAMASMDASMGIGGDEAPPAEGSAARLAAAVEALLAMPAMPSPDVARTGDVILGRMPEALGEASRAAAAVLSALHEQRRRPGRARAGGPRRARR